MLAGLRLRVGVEEIDRENLQMEQELSVTNSFLEAAFRDGGHIATVVDTRPSKRATIDAV